VALQEVVGKANSVGQTLQGTAEVATVIYVADSRQTHPRVLLRHANCFPLVQIVEAQADLLVICLIVGEALLAAVKHFVAPVAAEVHGLGMV
jgi:hypothetical protein